MMESKKFTKQLLFIVEDCKSFSECVKDLLLNKL